MNLRNIWAAVALAASLGVVAAHGQTATAPNEGAKLGFNAATGIYSFSWWGRAGRAYFVQQSEDLHTWTYLPVIEPGGGQVVSWNFTSNGARFFVRLKYTDAGTSNPAMADFDGDGVSDLDEVQEGTDPFSAEMDTTACRWTGKGTSSATRAFRPVATPTTMAYPILRNSATGPTRKTPTRTGTACRTAGKSRMGSFPIAMMRRWMRTATASAT